ncbi:uncharacterized protein LOC133815379 [Humulus lupulus]|uniref:uncharacterized protein LOC133815379 n=1 Tax=Humulus lupulus TaxID=3486 RepID=UPI002B412D4F|nr:uncharacterized protein LOC133815379 [Humulus lupulus]
MLEGSVKEQYAILDDYCKRLLATNPSCTVKLKTDLGILLVAVGINGNNSMFPIAYCVAEKENAEVWTWFLELLKDDLKNLSPTKVTIMSDHQKGLENAVGAIFSGCEVRYCVRHLHANFKKEYPGLLLKQLLWATTNTTTQDEFPREMQEVKDISNGAYNCFITKAELEKMTQPMGNIILKIIEKKKEVAKHCLVTRSDKFESQVQCNNGSVFVVDLEFRTCTCRRFQLSRLPCGHALATIWFMGGLNPIDPPPETKLPGRPMKARRKETNEPPSAIKKAQRTRQVKTCSNCLKTGHGRETCKYAKVVENRVVKKRCHPPLQKPTEATLKRKERRLNQHAKGGTSGAKNAQPDTI